MSVFMTVLPIPPTANNLFPTSRSGHRFPSKQYTAWKKEAAIWLQQRSVEIRNIPGKLKATYIYSFSDNRRRDIANFEKAVTDLLVQNGVIADDCDIDEMVLIRAAKGTTATVCVKIEALEAGL